MAAPISKQCNCSIPSIPISSHYANISMACICGLLETLDKKQDKVTLDYSQITQWNPSSYYEAPNDYVTYVNINSSDVKFQKEAIYRCDKNTIPGESPESTPNKWIAQGSVGFGTIEITDVIGLRAELDIINNTISDLVIPTEGIDTEINDSLTPNSTTYISPRKIWSWWNNLLSTFKITSWEIPTNDTVPSSKLVKDSLETITTALVDEIDLRISGDATLTTDLSTEIDNRVAADTIISDNLAQEIIDRSDADDLKINLVEKGNALGVATLDETSKIPISQIPQALLGATSFQGFWDASLNLPTLPPASTSNKGYYYIINVEGNTEIDGITDWKYGDWIISLGTVYGKVDNTDAVISVNGQLGLVVLTTNDVADSPNKRYVLDADLTRIANAVQTDNIKTINSNSIVGIGDITVEPVITSGSTSQYWRGDKTFVTLDKNAVGLSNVDNTTDLLKPISTATQTALDLKENTINKVTTFNSPTDVQYPSAKLVNDTFNAVQLGQAVTVGTGGQYVNIGAAVAAGKYNLIVVSNITETANITISLNINLYINGFSFFTVNFSTFYFTGGTKFSLFAYNLNFIFNSNMCNAAGETYNLFCEKCTISNTSSTVTLLTSGNYNIYWTDCILNLCNILNPFTNDPLYISAQKYVNCTINGGGTLGRFYLTNYANATCFATNIRFTGTFDRIYLGGEINGVYGNAVINTGIYVVGFSCPTSNISNINFSTAVLKNDNNALNRYSNFINGILSSYVNTGGGAVILLKFSNIKFINDCTFGTAETGSSINSCTFGISGDNRLITLSGSQIDFKSSTVYGTITNSGNKNIISNCFIGVSGGTTKTITLSSGASYNTIENCVFEIAPVDNSGNYTNTFRNNRLWDGTRLPDKLPLTYNKVLMGNVNGIAQETPTVVSTITVGDFTGAFAGLAIESNWTNNFTSSVSGVLGNVNFGVGENGCKYYAHYSQSGWNRVYTDQFIDTNTTLGLSIANALQTSSNWITGGYYYNHTSGDVGQQFRNGLWLYTCVNGTLHTWFRTEEPSGTVVTTDPTYLPFPQIEVNKADNATFVIPANCDIDSIIVEAETTTAGNISIGSADNLNDVVPSTSLPITVGTKKQLQYLINVNYPTTSTRTLYINVDSAATITLRMVIKKLF